MANTTNLDLVPLDGSAKLKNFPTPYNGNLDKIDGAVEKIRSFLVQVSNGNTHGALSQYDIVYVYNHSTLDEGFYIATSDIAANATLTSSNVSLSSGHRINALFDDIRSANLSLSRFENVIAIIADGDAHPSISKGQFVYVRFHNTLSPGLYTATSDIALNAALTSSNVQADGGSGGLNALNDQMGNLVRRIEATSTETTRNDAIHAWVSSYYSILHTSETCCISGVFNGVTYYGIIMKATNKVIVGTMFTPSANNGFRFRDSSNDSAATSSDFTL